MQKDTTVIAHCENWDLTCVTFWLYKYVNDNVNSSEYCVDTFIEEEAQFANQTAQRPISPAIKLSLRCSPLSPAAESSQHAWFEGTDPQLWIALDGMGLHELCLMELCTDWRKKQFHSWSHILIFFILAYFLLQNSLTQWSWSLLPWHYMIHKPASLNALLSWLRVSPLSLRKQRKNNHLLLQPS